MSKFPIIPAISAEESAKRITNANAKDMGKLISEKTLIQPFSEGHAFAHHASMTIFKGKIYAMWSSGRVNEDDCGQRVMWSYTDGFSDWQPTMLLDESEMVEHNEYVKFDSVFCSTPDRLYAYFGVSEYKQELLDGENLRPKICYADTPAWSVRLHYCCYLLDDGVSWSEPFLVDCGGGNHSCEIMQDGRYAFSLGVGIAYTDGFESGKVPQFTSSNVEQKYILAAKEKGAKEMCETSFFITDDGIVHIMMRSGETRLWHSESYDNGTTFGDVFPTGFSDDFAKFQFGRLPDGRYYYVGNPISGSIRLPLMLAVSENGYDFDKQYIIRDEPVTMQQKGLHKGGHYGYPECVIHNGYMYVIYSKMKEEVEITRFSLDQL